MKIEIVKDTTINGVDVATGKVVEVDHATFHLLKSQGQAKLYVPPVKTKKDDQNTENGEQPGSGLSTQTAAEIVSPKKPRAPRKPK